jgi:diketogulonate reductase-like aldo/keto reductase
MPQLGYGLYLVSPEEAERCTLDALKIGYRLIDTAQKYGNESGIKNSGIAREEIFLVSKIWRITTIRRLGIVLMEVCVSCRPTIWT